jgi:hypothetical protein
VINELRRIFKDRPFDVTDVWLGELHDAALAAAIDAEVPRARLKRTALRKALERLVGSGLVESESGRWSCTGGTDQWSQQVRRRDYRAAKGSNCSTATAR